MDEPLAGALAKLNEGGKAIRALPSRGRELVKRVPEPVQIQLARLSSRGAHVCREIFAGIVVVGLIAIVLGYGRLARGPISLPSLVAPIEASINAQLSDLSVTIEDAVLQRSDDGPGVVLRLRNVRLFDPEGDVVAQAPLAAIGLSGGALLSGRIAPGSVDFIGSRVLMTYSESQGLSLAFSRPGEDGDAVMRGALPADGDQTSGREQAAQSEPAPQPVARARKFNLTNTVNEVFHRVRGSDTSYLTRFGLKDSIVVLYRNGNRTLWQVPDFSIDLEHHDRRSVLVGQANVASSRGDWQLELRTEQNARTNGLTITALVENLVPSGIAGNFPTVGILRALDMAADGEAVVELSRTGEFISGEAKVRLAPGQIKLPWDPELPVRIDHGDITVRSIKGERTVEIVPSTLRWGESRATFSGAFRPELDDNGKAVLWNFDLRADDAVLAVEDHGLPPTKVDEWTATGSLSPADGAVTLSSFVMRAGDAKVTASGNVTDGFGSPAVHLTGGIGPMPVDTFKLFWPKFYYGWTREWFLASVSGGEVLGGTFNVALDADTVKAIGAGAPVPKGAVDVDLNFTGTHIAYLAELPPIVTGDGLLTISGAEFAVDIPAAKIVVSEGREVALTGGQFVIPNLRERPLRGLIDFHAAANTPDVMHLLNHESLGYITSVGLTPDFLGGTASGEFKLSMPIKWDLAVSDIGMSGVARLNDTVAPNVVGDMGIEGGGVDVILSSEGVSASGAVTIDRVPATIRWQRDFFAADKEQPPVSVSATLDEALRERLGINLDPYVTGPTPVTMYLKSLSDGTGGGTARNLRMDVDLGGAAVAFDALGWTKPAGKEAKISFDVNQKADGSTDLNDLRIVGDQLAVSGKVALNAEKRLESFDFPEFSTNALTHLSVRARLQRDGVLEVHAQGPSYDGRPFFHSLFSSSQLTSSGAADSGESLDIDLTAKIDRVVGYEDTTVTDADIKFQNRGGRFVGLHGKGNLNGQKPIWIELKHKNGARILEAEALDAGAAFRLVGFYRSIQDGQALLQINLDAGSAGQKSGTLTARDFSVVGDSVVADVLSDPSARAALGQSKPHAGRTIEFKRLRAPFVIGGGNFRLDDAYVNGPELGATLRGTVNFKSRTVDLGGTYVPLYGLNSALGAVPVLGKVFVGRQGEGVVGITFAIKGSLSDPTVLVNPMSVMTPGIFRQIFDFNAGVPTGGGRHDAETNEARTTRAKAAALIQSE